MNRRFFRDVGTPRRYHLLALLLVSLTLAGQALWARAEILARSHWPQDFLVMWFSTRLAFAGGDPYDAQGFRVHFENFLSRHHGLDWLPGNFFYPPPSLALFAPFAALPWETARIAWLVSLVAAGGLCALSVVLFGRRPRSLFLAGAIVFALLLANPLTARTLALGQTPLLIAAGVVLGQWLQERERPLAGGAAWSVAAIKPHLALPLLAYAYLLGGWRFAGTIVALVAAASLAVALLVFGDAGVLLRYLTIHEQYYAWGQNTVVWDQIVSWNRIWYVLTGHPVDLSPLVMLGGYALWAGALYLRHYRRGESAPPRAYQLAWATTGALLFAQAHGYDMLLLVLWVPYLLWLDDRGHRRQALALAGLILFATVPSTVVQAVIGLSPASGVATELLISYRALVVLLLALHCLARRAPAEAAEPPVAARAAGREALPSGFL